MFGYSGAGQAGPGHTPRHNTFSTGDQPDTSSPYAVELSSNLRQVSHLHGKGHSCFVKLVKLREGQTIVSAPKRLFLAPNGSRRFFTFLHQNYFFSAPNSFFFHTKTIFFAPNHFCKLIRFCTKFILILHQIFCKLGQNYIDFAPNISWNFSGLAPNLFRSSTKLSPISTNFFWP